jgi:hypothetical protein
MECGRLQQYTPKLNIRDWENLNKPGSATGLKQTLENGGKAI